MVRTADKPAPRRNALGRGLSALIPGAEDAPETPGLRLLALDVLQAGTYQPRQHFDPRSLEDLAASIRRFGVLQPLVVRPLGGGRFEIVAGERRARAARLADLTEVPVVVHELEAEAQLEIALIENVQRADLNPVEEARGYIQLMDTFGLTQQEVAERIGKSRPYIANKVRLLQLPEEVQMHLVQGDLSEGHVRALLAIEDREALLEAAEAARRDGLSVRATETLARTRKRKRTSGLDADWEALRRDLESQLGLPVKVTRTARGGQLAIRFYSDDQFDDFVRRVLRR